MTQLMPDQPQFAVAMRGYDRDQVDDYVARLHEWAAEWRERAAAAERDSRGAVEQLEHMKQRLARLDAPSSAPESIQALGDRVGHILQSAFDAAEDMRVQGTSEAEALRAEAAAEVDRLRAEAEGITGAAGSELRQLEERREAVLEQIRQLHRQLGRALAAVERRGDAADDDAGDVTILMPSISTP